MNIQGSKLPPDQQSENGGVVVAIILAIMALIVAIISVFFYMNIWGSRTTSRTYPVKPIPAAKTIVTDENINQFTNSNVQVNTDVNKNNDVDSNTNGNPTNVNGAVETNLELVQLTTPLASSTVTSPIEISGSAPGNWFFEGVFPITLVDADGQELAHTQAQPLGDWMTIELVEFSASLEYTATKTTMAELVFKPDNPSGLPNTTSYSIPVILTATE